LLQLFGVSCSRDLAGIQHDHMVGVADRGGAVGDLNDGPTALP
jgi:hypothetical protein